MSRTIGFGLLFFLLATAGCASRQAMVARPTPWKDLTAVVQVPEHLITTTLSYGSQPNLFGIDTPVCKEYYLWLYAGRVDWGKEGASEDLVFLNYGIMGEGLMQLRPGPQRLLLFGNVYGGYRHTFSKTLIHVLLKDYDFKPGQYRIKGRTLSLEVTKTGGMTSTFEIWLEKESGEGIFERVATFDVRQID